MLWSVLRGVCGVWKDLLVIRSPELVGCGVLSRMLNGIAGGRGCEDSRIKMRLSVGFTRCGLCSGCVVLCVAFVHLWQIVRLWFFRGSVGLLGALCGGWVRVPLGSAGGWLGNTH